MKSQVVRLYSIEQSCILAQHLIALINPHLRVITLSGSLGSGKTTICREIIKGIIGKDTLVNSPTFNILQSYENDRTIIHHYDLYRLEHSREIYELNFDEALYRGFCLIEWPEIINHLLPVWRIELELEYLKNEYRTCKIIYPANVSLQLAPLDLLSN